MDELNTDLAALEAALGKVQDDVTALPAPSSDPVATAAIAALEELGYTVTPPEAEIPATT